MDAGASTGGFVDCLLQRGAAHVVAIDVGWGQLDARLRADARVTVRERCNLRHVGPAEIGAAADITTADLSFISLRTVMANLAACTTVSGDAVLLVKPQFEAGRREASRGKGVVRDPGVWRHVLGEVTASATANGLTPVGVAVSPLRGASGNVEFFLHCRRVAGASIDVEAEPWARAARQRASDEHGEQERATAAATASRFINPSTFLDSDIESAIARASAVTIAAGPENSP